MELEQTLATATRRNGSAEERAEAQRELQRSLTIAFPEYRSTALAAGDTAGDYLVAIQGAFLRGDTADARRRLGLITEERRTVHPTDLTFDALYPEAATIALMGDVRGAAKWLDPTLDELAQVAVQTLVGGDGARAGPLIRAAVLRADIAAGIGDRATARRYANAIVVLWANADDFLQPTVRRMRALAG
jgi:hypothetical protein